MKNRKNKLTNLFKIGVFLFGISILLWNCQQEEINYSENVITKKKLEYSVQKIHYYDLVNDVEFQKSLKIVKNKFANNKEQQNTYNRNTTQINNDLVILTEEVNRVDTNDGIITWTFETEAPVFEGSDFENFVVKKQNDEFYYYLISYKYNTDILADEYETIESYRVREEYLTLDNLNLSSRNSDAFDWVYPDSGGGGGSNCAEIYTEIEPCSSGGYHTLKYACQHYGGSHGVSNSPPCDDVCSGTTVVTVLDYSNCGNVTYDPPSGPTGDPNDGQIDGGGYGVPTGGGGYGVPTGGGGLPSGDSNANPVGNIPVGPTVSAPISNSDGTTVDTSDININQINELLNYSLTQNQIDWLGNNPNDASLILTLLTINSSIQTQDFIQQAFTFLINNSQYNFAQYENWFGSNYPNLVPNGDEINPNDITYDSPLIQQELPSFNNFLNNFPKNGTSGNYSEMSTSNVYNLVGGSLLTSHLENPSSYSNACSIRGSRALLYSNISIPVLHYNNTQRTQKGGDNKNYILDAVSFQKYMIDKFGDTSNKLEGADANDAVKVANLLNGKNGIYVIINNSYQQAGYSGHVDAIINGICIGGAYTGVSGGVKSIRIWELN